METTLGVIPMAKQKPVVLDRVKLFRYFEDYGISLEDVAKKTGYAPNTLVNFRNGSNDLSAAARFRFVMAYPDTQEFLMPDLPRPGTNND